ncbi:hypothetical protein HID58_048734, partial [Brassica napus]
GGKIHASCNKAHMFRTQRNLPIGEWRVVENFKINITNETVFTGSDYHDDRSFLSLANFDELSKGKLDTKLLIDILGQPYDVTEVRIVQVKNEERKMIQFRMRDTWYFFLNRNWLLMYLGFNNPNVVFNSGNEVACCLWGSYAEKIEQYAQESDIENNVFLLRFAKITEFRGDIQVTNAFDATVLDLNPTVPEADVFKDKMKDDLRPLSLNGNKEEKREIVSVRDDWDDIGINMICELSQITEVEKTKIICSIKTVDTDWRWYYIGCKRCSHSVTMITGKGNTTDKPLFRCRDCRATVSNVEPKFKLHLIVEDDTGTCKIMLLDSVAKTIIGDEAKNLWDGSYEEIEDPKILPLPIQALVGKSFCFGVACSDGTDIYKVSEVWSGDFIQKVESNSEPVSQIEGVSSSLSSGGETLKNLLNVLLQYLKEKKLILIYQSSLQLQKRYAQLQSSSRRLRPIRGGRCLKLLLDMKRKRGDGNGDQRENMLPISQVPRNANASPELTSSSVPLRSIFSRVFHQIGSSPLSKSSSPLNQPHHESNNIEQTPTYKPVRLFGKIKITSSTLLSNYVGVDLMSKQTSYTPINMSCLTSHYFSNLPNSSLTSAQIIHSKRQRNTSLHLLEYITLQIKKKQAAEDDLNEGNIDGEGELDFDYSSQESTDSENDGLDNQMMDIVAHASPATNPYQPESFSMSRILQQCKKGVSMSNNG